MIIKLIQFNDQTFDFIAEADGKPCRVDPFIGLCLGFKVNTLEQATVAGFVAEGNIYEVKEPIIHYNMPYATYYPVADDFKLIKQN